MVFDSLNILLPLILLIVGGFTVGRLFKLSEGTLVRVVTDFFMPMLVFYSFCTTKISVDSISRIIVSVILVIVVMLILSWLYCRAFHLDMKAVSPPILFMNSGFLGIPLMKLWGGIEPMNLIVIYDQVQTFFIFTLGIVIVTGGYRLSGLKEMARTPLIWAILLGFGFNLSQTEVPQPLLDAFRFGGEAAPSLATFTIGMTLNRFRIKLDMHVFAGVILRMVFGFMAGMAAVLLLGFSGPSAIVIIIASSLPSAVFSVVLPVRYGVNGQYASSVLIISTILSFLILPFLFEISQSHFM